MITQNNIIMKKLLNMILASLFLVASSCNDSSTSSNEKTSTDNSTVQGGQEKVNDTTSAKDVVKVAVGSPDHTTLVAALKQADLVRALSNSGPFTVFAPTNAAFDALPKGTLDELMKPEKKEDLQNILQYHVTLAAQKAESWQDGQSLGMVNGDNVKVSVKDGKITLNDNVHIIASVIASNGIVHIVDGVLLPPKK